MSMTRRTVLSAWILGGLLLMVLLAVMVTPSAEEGTPYSSYSAGAEGVRLSRDLIGRLGWTPEAREVPFADTRDPAPIQVLVGVDVSDREAAALLRFVRAGGSLLVAGDVPAFQDSLGVYAENGAGQYQESSLGSTCERRGTWRSELAQVAYASSIGWTRPPPPDTIGFGRVVIERRNQPRVEERAAVGMPLGAGRIVVIADETFLVNDVIRRCELETDAEFVRMIEYLSRGSRGLRVAFDEYHHGYGVHGGSFAAIRMYLAGTPSGRMLAQIGVGLLLLLAAAAPRPLAPRDPTHVARRSPLEHADALAHAYASVNATRTATARLLAGVRRRVRSRSRPGDTDEGFLAAAASASPLAARATQTVAAALASTIPARQLPEVASALETIERELTRPPSSTTR